MIKLSQCVIVEGKYDKQKLRGLLDATILATNGFRIFQDKEKRTLIKTLAQKNGIIILTDSDRAGFQIRNHIKSFVPARQITNVYIPAIAGKEKRKAESSKEGLLGVEGVSNQVLIAALQNAGITAKQTNYPEQYITKLDLYEDGFSGKPDSAAYRARLLQHLSLPRYMTANSILEILNATMSIEEYHFMVEKIKEQEIPDVPNKTGGNFSLANEK